MCGNSILVQDNAFRAHDGCAQMRASQILTEKSINEKLENSTFKHKFLLLDYYKLF